MAAWDEQDINNPENFKPRSRPRVKSAPNLIRTSAGEFQLPPSFSKNLQNKSAKVYPPEAFDHDPYANEKFDRDPYAQEETAQEAPAPGSRQGEGADFGFDEALPFHIPLSAVPEGQPNSPAKRTGPQGVNWGRRKEDRMGTKPGAVEEKAGANGNPPHAQPLPGKAAPGAMGPTGHSGKKGKSGKGLTGSPYFYVAIITLCTLALSFIVVMMMPQVAGYFWKDVPNYAFVNGEMLIYDKETAQTYKRYRDYMRSDVIFPGVFVDGVSLGDMTMAQAQDALQGTQGQPIQGTASVTVAIGNKTWVFDQSNVPATRDLGNVLEQAFAIGRGNTPEILGTKITPFKERVDTALRLRESGINLEAKAAYDHQAVRKLVDEIATAVTRPPKDSQIASFDFNTRTFQFTDEQVGVTLDPEALYQKVTASLDRWEKGVVVTVEPVLTQPTVTKAKLSADFKMTAAFTTDTTNDKNRNNNIDLACQAINGRALMPGEKFSFNEATGQRTTAKGYREAGAISAGQSIEEVGGGICQVSSTLFNAVARADLEVTSRSPHAWPSTYVNRGEDATVNWPNLDFQFKNNKNTPVFIITYYKDRKCSAEIWGYSLGAGITIDLKSEVVRTMEPPIDALYVVNPNMPYGTSKETIKSRTGYVVDTYKVWLQNGQEVKREKMHTSTYKAYQRTIEYN